MKTTVYALTQTYELNSVSTIFKVELDESQAEQEMKIVLHGLAKETHVYTDRQGRRYVKCNLGKVYYDIEKAVMTLDI